jgi:hypothetical protein
LKHELKQELDKETWRLKHGLDIETYPMTLSMAILLKHGLKQNTDF